MRLTFCSVAFWSAVLASGCRSAGGDGLSPAYLVIASLEAAPGQAAPTAFGHTLQSDVRTAGRVVEDPGRVSFVLGLRDPGTAELPTRPTIANAVTLERYRVRYFRADGRNAEGVDVPHAFDGAMTLTVGPEAVTGTFVLVRAQAKLEAPLAALADGGGAVVISALAEVTFHGRDQSGRVVAVAGLVGVNFADWADAEAGP